jgi:8-oxo-dGTP pyrophosphatase MutT (NUDIX family)
MTEIIYSGHTLVFQDGKILLVKHGEEAEHLTGVYGIPGGRPSQGESIINTAARELFEETGLRASKKDLREFPNNEYTADIKRKNGVKRMTMTVFICTKFQGELKSSGESVPEWVEIGKLDRYNLVPNVKKATLAGYRFFRK